MKKVLDIGTNWEYTYAAWMTDMRISQESISDQLFKKGDAIMGRGLNLCFRHSSGRDHGSNWSSREVGYEKNVYTDDLFVGL